MYLRKADQALLIPEVDKLTFYKKEAERLGSELENYILELSAMIGNISQPKQFSKKGWSISSFYLYFHFRKVTDREYYLLCLSIQWVMSHSLPKFRKEGASYFILYDLFENVVRNEKRFVGSKFYKAFVYVLDSLEKYIGIDKMLPPPREWKGNYSPPLFKPILERIFTIRTIRHENTYLSQELNRRSKKVDRPRGYTDQGSESSISERARRKANQGSFADVEQEYLKKQKELAQLSWIKFQFLRKEKRE